MQKTTLIFALIFSIYHLAISQTNGWHNGGGNWQKNGFADVAGPTGDSILWQVNSPGIFGTPLFIEGNYLVTMRFLSTTNAPVACFNLTTGNLLWSVDVTNGAGRSLPVGLRDQKVFVVRLTESQNDSLFALDVATGARLWASNVLVAPYISETAVFDSIGNLYINGNLKTYKINPANGQMIWQTTTVPMASGSGEMAIHNSNNTGYTLEQSGGISFLWAIDLVSGQKKYKHVVSDLQPGGNVPQSALMVGRNGIIYVQLTEDNVAAFSDNGTKFTPLWQTRISGNAAFSLMCSGPDGSVYAPAGGRIIRLDPLTGDTLNLSAVITQGGFFSPRISAANNNMIYVTNGENYVYGFDTALNMLWSDFFPNTNTSGVCIAPNGLAAVAGQNRVRVYKPAAVSSTDEPARIAANLYPNPAGAFVTLRCEGLPAGALCAFVDVSGQVVKTNFTQGGSTVFDLSDMAPGLYFLKVEGVREPVKLMRLGR
jgi:outer membrane protein assembly factor BamB